MYLCPVCSTCLLAGPGLQNALVAMCVRFYVIQLRDISVSIGSGVANSLKAAITGSGSESVELHSRMVYQITAWRPHNILSMKEKGRWYLSDCLV
jgi:hypothetical protein